MPNDRDSSIEAMLRARRSGNTVPGESCLDAETLAGWMDGALAPAARDGAERHAARCDRCQALLAAMARTAPAAAAAPPRRWWRAGLLLPLGAIAAAMLVWIAVDRQSNGVRPSLGTPASSPVAESRGVVVPEGAPSKSAPREEATRDLAQAPAASTSSPRRAPSRQATNHPSPEETKFAKVPEPKRGSADALAQAAPPRTENAASIAAVPPLPAQPFGGLTAPPVRTPAAAAPALTESVQVIAESPARAGVAGAGAEATPLAKSVAGARSDASLEVVSPDGKSRWLLIGPTTIERSTDGGVSWTPQTIGTTPLGLTSQGLSIAAPQWTVGSSPSRDVCWIAGRRGMVLVSTDGTTWQVHRLAEPADLIAIHAVDARTASVTAADGRQFSTADGGVSWAQVRARPPAERE